jgi:hypothetical protein
MRRARLSQVVLTFLFDAVLGLILVLGFVPGSRDLFLSVLLSALW